MSVITKTAYKIEAKDIWEQATDDGVYHGSVLDKKDGYIHLSTASQLQRTFSLHFAGRENLIVAAIDLDKLGEKIIWEPSRGGELFPHLYDSLPKSAIIETLSIVYDADGIGEIPQSILRHG